MTGANATSQSDGRPLSVASGGTSNSASVRRDTPSYARTTGERPNAGVRASRGDEVSLFGKSLE